MVLVLGSNKSSKSKVRVGDLAPDFTLPSQWGEMINLSDFRGKNCVVLYFYPKDETRGCTAEACAFRDSYEVFKEVGAEVIGISSDSIESHSKFALHHKLPFILLSDEGSKVRKLYGVSSTLKLIPGRWTYIIDKKGVIRYIFSSQFRPSKHVKEALQVLKDIPECGES